MAYITPTLFTPWVQQQLQMTQNLISLGLVTVDTNSPISEMGQFFKIPQQTPLSAVASVQQITSSTTLTPAATADVEEIGVVVHNGDSYYMTGIDKLERGMDGLAQIAPQIAKVALDGIQTHLVAATKGVIGTAGAIADTHVYTPANGTLDIDAILYGTQYVYGENMDSMEAIIMHSAKFASFTSANLVTYEDAGDFGSTILYQGKVPTVLGKRVLINDTLCAAIANKYSTYVVKGQPWYLGYQKTLNVKYDTDILTGGGKDYLAWYVDYVPHVKGVSWTSATANPTTVQLATVGNWTQKEQNYNIGIMRIETD